MNVLSQVEAGLAVLAAIPTVDEVHAKLEAGGAISELEALVTLRHCLDTGQVNVITMALGEDVRFISKWQHLRGRHEVLIFLRKIAAGHASARRERIKRGVAPSLPHVDLHCPAYRTLLSFVDGRVAGFSLAMVDEGHVGTFGSFGAAVAGGRAEGHGSKVGRINTISSSHFEDFVSGYAQFGALSCVPGVEALQRSTQFDVQAESDQSGRVALSITTSTDRFECNLQTGDAARLVRWAKAAACGADHCGADLWQRCRMKLTAQALAPGWIRLVVRSARTSERHDLVAVISVHDLVSKLRAAFERLTARIVVDQRHGQGVRLVDLVPELRDGDNRDGGLEELGRLSTAELFIHLAQLLADQRGSRDRVDVLRTRVEVAFGSAATRQTEVALGMPSNYASLSPDDRITFLRSRRCVVLAAPKGDPLGRLDRLDWPTVGKPEPWAAEA